MQIVDNSPELDLSDPKQAALLTGTPVKEEPKVESKEEPKVEPNAEVPPVEEEEPVDKDAQIKGLKAELARRNGQSDKIRELELELAKKQGASEAKETGDPVAKAISDLADKDLITKQTDWEDELAAARAKYERAEETQNETALQNAQNRIAHAKRVLTALKQEVVDRQERRAFERDAQKTEANQLKSELDSMYADVTEVFPDFQDPSTELWKAGNEEYKANPELMKRLGPAGELVAAAMAILKNGGKGTGNAATRKEVLNSIDKGFGKALSKGASTPATAKTPNWNINNGEDLQKFNEYIDKIKGG